MHCNRTAKQHQPPHRQFVFKSIYSFLANINWNQRPHHATVPSSVKIRHPSPSRAQAWNHSFFSPVQAGHCDLRSLSLRFKTATPALTAAGFDTGSATESSERRPWTAASAAATSCVCRQPRAKGKPALFNSYPRKEKIMAWYDDMMWLMIHDSDVNFLSSKT